MTAQNGSTRGTSILQTGSSFRSRAATLCQACKSVYAFGSVKIVTGLFAESEHKCLSAVLGGDFNFRIYEQELLADWRECELRPEDVSQQEQVR